MLTRIRFKIVLCLLTALGFWAVGVGASIRVFVRLEPQDARVGTIRLTLIDIRTGGTLRTITLTDDRSFAFGRVWSGRYLIRAESMGFQTSETEIEMTAFSRNDRQLATVILRRDPDAPHSLPEPGEDTVSVSTLSIPSEALDEMDQARKASRKGESLKALEHLKRAVEIHPQLYQAYNNQAVEYTKLGRFQEAAQALEKSIVIEPNGATAHRNLAQIYLTVGGLSKALNLVTRSLELEPRNSKSLSILGRIHIRHGNYQTALDYFRQASKIDKADHSYIGIGECLTLLGRYEEALSEFKSFVDLFPDDPRTSGVLTVISRLETDLRLAKP